MHDGLLGLFHVFRSTQARYRVVITGLTYVVAWSAHGDALSVSEVDPATGGATAANRYSYQTWGRPATTTANGYPDLRFRYLWVGASDVQWDDAAGEALYYMHARTYSPAIGRFLQPDPARADGSLYAYAGNSPVTKGDPSGLDDSSLAAAGFKINWMEKQYCNANFLRCLHWKEASAWAVAMTKFRYPDSEVQNSMRHCTWQCLLSYYDGAATAREWGWRHELGADVWMATDTKIDLHNNAVGRLLGQHLHEIAWFYGPAGGALKLCREAWNAGYLWTYAYGQIRWTNGSAVSNPTYEW